MPKKAQFTQERVKYNGFLFDEPLKGSKSLKMFKISLTFRFDKLSNLSKSVHTGENSQILRVSNKKTNCVFGCNTCRKNEPEACFYLFPRCGAKAKYVFIENVFCSNLKTG
jgi:hypothetical protein